MWERQEIHDQVSWIVKHSAFCSVMPRHWHNHISCRQWSWQGYNKCPPTFKISGNHVRSAAVFQAGSHNTHFDTIALHSHGDAGNKITRRCGKGTHRDPLSFKMNAEIMWLGHSDVDATHSRTTKTRVWKREIQIIWSWEIKSKLLFSSLLCVIYRSSNVG